MQLRQSSAKISLTVEHLRCDSVKIYSTYGAIDSFLDILASENLSRISVHTLSIRKERFDSLA